MRNLAVIWAFRLLMVGVGFTVAMAVNAVISHDILGAILDSIGTVICLLFSILLVLVDYLSKDDKKIQLTKMIDP